MVFMVEKNHDEKDKMKDDKFILMGLDEAGDLGEVLKNKTSKKILNFLGDVREASEKDISDKLDMPINTVEYNLKKLIKARLVERTKNFFWSVKGKKIPMYKLAKKHIIIGTKKPNLNYIKTLLPVFIAAIVLIAIASIFMYQSPDEPGISLIDSELKQFSSQAELEKFVEENADSSGFWEETVGGLTRNLGAPGAMIETATDGAGASSQAKADDYSTTNIQVQGVDEADIVKNDGKYIYYTSGNKLYIVNAYPAETMDVLSEIEFESYVSEIFINEDKLIVFGNEYGKSGDVNRGIAVSSEIACYGGGCYGNSNSVVKIYDISDKKNPELEDTIGADGNYIDSRMIGDYVYAINTKYVNVRSPEPPIYEVSGVKEKVIASDVYYMPYPSNNYIFTSVMAIDLDNNDFESKVFLTDSARTLYVSQDNIYLTHMKSFDYETYAEDLAEEVYFPILSSEYDERIEKILDYEDDNHWEKQVKMRVVMNDYLESVEVNELDEISKELEQRLEDFNLKIQKEREKTIVHKINIDGMNIEYLGNGEIPGGVLNQFSMDEHEGNFRIATTTRGNVGGSLNHLYILDEDLEIIGSVEDLAKGERIYSARFLGDRAYIVTFKKVDPLFVIDTSNPEKPEVLGYLKITGYSDYLHIYDENHVIGIGKETIAAEQEDFAWYQGVKVSLFDVSDVENPVERAKFEIGDRGTNSDALHDHKAVLFDREKNLLVLPIELYEIDEDDYNNYDREITDNTYGEFVWQGAFVLDISLEGIEERGRISHGSFLENDRGYRYSDYNKKIKRSLYMDDVLYTLSNSMIKANDLDSINFISEIKWDIGTDYPIYYEDAIAI